METLVYNGRGKVHNIELFKDNKLVGFIHAKPIDIMLNKIELPVYYVDFLCIHTENRRENLSTYLIAELINRCHQTQIFVFKKDNTPLPFNYVAKTTYFYKFIKDIKKVAITHTFHKNPSNLRDIYDFIQSIKKDYQCYDILQFEDFKKIYVDTLSKNIIVEYRGDTIVCVILYVNNLFTYNDKYHNTLDIEYIYCRGDTQIIDYLKHIYVSPNTIITCLEQMNNLYFIKKYGFTKSMDLFYHMYNYTINKILDTDRIAFNPL